MDPVVVRGILGWGNRKEGLEAYGPGGRWHGKPRRSDQEARDGDLLGDALERIGVSEGADLIVVAIPRGHFGYERDAYMEALDAVTAQITTLVGAPAYVPLSDEVLGGKGHG